MASTIWAGEKTFSATSGEESLVAVPMPHRGILRGYSLTQTSGTNAGFTAALYTSNQATTPNSTLPAEAFHVVDITAANTVSKVDNHNTSLSYINRDGTPTNPQRYLYLRITPAGSGAKNFVLSVTVETPMLR
jgi:hypothetical protein